MPLAPPLEIERVDAPTPEEFARRFLGPRKPVVMSGLLADWPAVEKWNPDFFAERYPDRKFHAWEWAAGPRNDAIDFVRNKKSVVVTWREYAERLAKEQASRALYAALYIVRLYPELRADIGSLERFTNRGFLPKRLRQDFEEAYLWIGPAGSITPLHFDACETFLCQLQGRKRVTLFSPEQKRHLYFSDPELRKQEYLYSPVDVESPDLARHPEFANAQRHEAVIRPGDVLYMPYRWWHHVRALDPSTSLNFAWSRLRRLVADPRTSMEVWRRRLRARAVKSA